MVACSIDTRVAFDLIDCDESWKVMVANGVSFKRVNLVKSYYGGTKARVQANGEESYPFKLKYKVR